MAIPVNFVTTNPSRFSVIQPALLPPMQVLESIDIEKNIQDRLAQLVVIWNKYDPPNAAQYDVGNLEFDPIKITQELNAYFEALVRDRVNQAARAITLAFSVGSDIDAIASSYPAGGVPRKTANATDPALLWTGQGTQETDALYKQRIWLAPNILSLDGPGQGVYESYQFWALTAPQFVGELPLKDATAYTVPHTGDVYISILPYQPLNTTWINDPVHPHVWTLNPGAVSIPTSNQISAVWQYVNEKYQGRKGLTDVVTVIKPPVTNLALEFQVLGFPGVDEASVMAAVTSAMAQLLVASNWLGVDLTMLALDGALAQAGVYNVIWKNPIADVIVAQGGIINVTSVKATWIGTAE